MATITRGWSKPRSSPSPGSAVNFQIIWNALRELMQRALEALVMERQAEGEVQSPVEPPRPSEINDRFVIDFAPNAAAPGAAPPRATSSAIKKLTGGLLRAQQYQPRVFSAKVIGPRGGS